MKYQKAGRPRYYMNSPSPCIENWKLIAKKKKFQTKLSPTVSGERLLAITISSLTCFMTPNMVKKERMITMVARKE